jgi:hypothetical protein
MRKTTLLIAAAAMATAGIGTITTTSAEAAKAAKGNCFVKAAEGTNTDLAGAKFQAYEAILQSFDWGAWASWMANKTTPGYKVTTTKERCTKGGLGMTCVTQATICKL